MSEMDYPIYTQPMSRRQGKGDYRGGSTIVRLGGVGFTPLDEDYIAAKEPAPITAATIKVQKRSEIAPPKGAKRRYRPAKSKRKSKKKWFDAQRS